MLANIGKANWTQVSPGKSPLSRSSHGVSFNQNDNCVYVWGGENKARHSIDKTLWKFDGNNWSEVATTGDSPSPRIAHAQIIENNVLWVWGGRQGEEMGEGDLCDLFKLDLTSLKWENLTATGDFPPPRSFHQMCGTPGKLHVFGGCSGKDRLADLHTLDLKTLEWTKEPKNEKIKGKGGAGFASHGNYLYVIAGFCGEETNDCYRFDIEKKEWIEIPSDGLRPRSVFGTCTVGDFVVIFGGEVDPSAAGHMGAGDFADDLVVLNTSTLKFGELEQNVRPRGRGWTRLAAKDSESFVMFGGLAGNDEKPERLDDTWECKIQM